MEPSLNPTLENNLTEKDVIFAGSKTFSLASLFFSKKQKLGAWSLYRWCRFVDDEIDNCPDSSLLSDRLSQVRKQTQAAFAGKSVQGSAYTALSHVAFEFGINSEYAEDLIRGLEWDTQETRIRNEEELKDYCYCVAGTVGMMMTRVMGVQEPRAPQAARSLGQAMQMTNIARDVQEDLERNRIYIPLTWLNETELSETQFMNDPTSRIPVVLRLLNCAEESYQEGLAGLCYLPFRAALAVASAALIYRQIGRRIQRSPEIFLTKRCFVPFWQKIFLVLAAHILVVRLQLRRSHAPR